MWFQTTGNIWHFCSVGLKISALQPLTSDPVLSWEQRVTSVAVTSTGHHTVALLGTQHGTLKKVRCENGIRCRKTVIRTAALRSNECAPVCQWLKGSARWVRKYEHPAY